MELFEMGSVLVRNLADDVHRALKMVAKKNNRSTEAEIRIIITDAVMPPKRVRLGTLLNSIAKKAGYMTDEEIKAMCFREKNAIEVNFE